MCVVGSNEMVRVYIYDDSHRMTVAHSNSNDNCSGFSNRELTYQKPPGEYERRRPQSRRSSTEPTSGTTYAGSFGYSACLDEPSLTVDSGPDGASGQSRRQCGWDFSIGILLRTQLLAKDPAVATMDTILLGRTDSDKNAYVEHSGDAVDSSHLGTEIQV